MWSIFRQDLQLMQLDSDRARLWSERSDVKCVKWCEVTLIFMRFSCGFHVVDLSRHHRGSSRRPRNRPCNCSRRQCRPCSRRCSRRCSRECFKHPWCSFNNHRCRWCRTQSQRFNVTEGEKSSHGVINFIYFETVKHRGTWWHSRGEFKLWGSGTWKKLPERKKNRQTKNQPKNSKPPETNLETSDFVPLTL